VSNLPLPSAAPNGRAEAADTDARFDALVRGHYARLCNFALRLLGSSDVVEDIVQDVFLAIWKQRATFRYDDPLPYLYKAVRNRAVMHARRQGVRHRWQEREEAAGQPPCIDDTATEVECTDLAREMARAIDALPERCRLVFTMSREQELSYGEIARLLGISVKTVETQMGRALKTLRNQLADYLTVALTVAASAGGWRA
jgi:RNA polymerase sigma-70 factor (ECF subfamily)